MFALPFGRRIHKWTGKTVDTHTDNRTRMTIDTMIRKTIDTMLHTPFHTPVRINSCIHIRQIGNLIGSRPDTRYTPVRRLDNRVSNCFDRSRMCYNNSFLHLPFICFNHGFRPAAVGLRYGF